jgi:hypothetical protein
MRKTIIFTCLALSGLMILDSFNVGHALMMFLLAGIIPGTNLAISAQNMIEFFALLTGFVVARIFNRFTIALFDRIPVRRQA